MARPHAQSKKKTNRGGLLGATARAVALTLATHASTSEATRAIARRATSEAALAGSVATLTLTAKRAGGGARLLLLVGVGHDHLRHCE
jgi:hypothetical protein